MTASTSEPTTSAATPPPVRRDPSRGELLVDVLLVVGIGYYLWVADAYPKDGREIPMVVGTVALVAAVVQLIGWFVPALRNLTHGSPAQESDDRPAVTRAPLADATAPEPAEAVAAESPAVPAHRAADVPVAMAWAAGFVGAILVVGYVIAVPLFFFAYFASLRSWKLAIVSAVVMGLTTSLLFETALGIPLPGGLLY